MKLVLFVFILVMSLEAQANVPWRETMRGTCWTNASCMRAMIVSHGGDWNLEFPYDSLPAFERAFMDGAEGVKGDFRVSSDNVGVIMHSSPIEWYESPECEGRLVENMTATECTNCKMALTNFTFRSLPEVAAWSKGKVILMLCVKRADDIARAISSLVELNITDNAFLEIQVTDLKAFVMNQKPVGWDQVYYLAEGSSADDLQFVLSDEFDELRLRCPLFEFNTNYLEWGVNVSQAIESLHSKGHHTFTATGDFFPSIESQVALFESGIDIVYTYDTPNGVAARSTVNVKRGISPP